MSLLRLGSSWMLLPVARQLQAKDDGRQQGWREMPCQRGFRLPHPLPSPPQLVKYLVSWFTYNATTGGIIKEGVLVLDVVPADTKKASAHFITVSLSWDHLSPQAQGKHLENNIARWVRHTHTHTLTHTYDVYTLSNPVILKTFQRNLSLGKQIQQKEKSSLH